jgi:Brp/Blh family beta-carotene 15,15'-monooxygenase
MESSTAASTWAARLVGCLTTLALLAALPAPSLPVVLALLVGVVGMPHGGLDHRVGRRLLRPTLGWCWGPAFLAGYAALMAAVLAGWALAPLCTLAGFVLLSALHFGMADEQPRSPGSVAHAVLCGGMVVWVPSLARPTEMTQLLLWVVPGRLWPPDFLFLPAVRAALWLALALVLAGAARSPFGQAGLRTLCLVALFVLAPPLVAFAVYFCGWHSVTELARLARQANPTDPPAGLRTVIAAAAPLSAAACLLVIAGWLVVESGRPLAPGVVRALFVGLSVVAVPHVLLHLLAQRRGVDPFHAGGPA